MATPNWVRKMGSYDVFIGLIVNLVVILIILGLNHKLMSGSDEQQEYFGRVITDLLFASGCFWFTVAFYRRRKRTKIEKHKGDQL